MLGKGRFDVTDRLGTLEEAEVRARQSVEEARREAQRIRLSIAAQVEELESRKDRNLAASREKAGERVREEVARLESELDDQASVRMAELDRRGPELREKAEEILTRIILTGTGEEG
jgi:DNA anti-recombination protein RmuC